MHAVCDHLDPPTKGEMTREERERMGRIPLGFIAFPFAAIATMKAKKAPSLFIAERERLTNDPLFFQTSNDRATEE